MLNYCVCAGCRYACEDIKFYISVTRKGVGWHQCAKNKKGFSATSARKSGAVMHDAHFKQKDCMVIIYNILHTSISLYIFLVERRRAHRSKKLSQKFRQLTSAGNATHVYCHDLTLAPLPGRCEMCVSRVAPSLYVTVSASRFQNKSTSTASPEVTV